MYLVIKKRLRVSKNEKRLLTLLTHVAKNIYNVSLYNIRQYYFSKHTIIPYSKLKELVYNNQNRKMLNPYQTAVIISEAYNAFKLYLKYYNSDGTIKEYYKNNQAALAYRFPNYKKINGYGSLIFSELKYKKAKISKELNLPLSYLVESGRAFNWQSNDELLDKFIRRSRLKNEQKFSVRIPRPLYNKTIKQVKIVPKENGEFFEAQFLYEPQYEPVKAQLKTEELAIDFGITNLATCVATTNESFIIDGKELKSILRLYNKHIASAKAKLPFVPKTNKTNQLKISKKISRLYYHLNNAVENYLNVSIKNLFNKIEELGIKHVIMGWNDGFKREGIKNDNISTKAKSRANQSFIGVPLARFRDKIINRARRLGIAVTIINESYTSKASFYDNDPFYAKAYSGERIERGLYRRADGALVNADVNAALNIYRKYCDKRTSNRKQLDFLMSSGLSVPYRIRA